MKHLPKKVVQQAAGSTIVTGGGGGGAHEIDMCYTEYDVSELCLWDQRLDYVDFIQKFIRWNFACKTLKLCNLDLSRVQD